MLSGGYIDLLIIQDSFVRNCNITDSHRNYLSSAKATPFLVKPMIRINFDVGITNSGLDLSGHQLGPVTLPQKELKLHNPTRYVDIEISLCTGKGSSGIPEWYVIESLDT